MHEPQSQRLAYWPKLQAVVEQGRLPQALLLSAPAYVNLRTVAQALVEQMFCHATIQAPCGQCVACTLMHEGTHPDIQRIEPEKADHPIKVDQIRDMQQTVYQTPQRGNLRFVILQPADKMNQAAANALLKILEEPPSHTHFILLVEQVMALPVTVRSRCQHHALHGEYFANYLALSQLYPQVHVRFQLHEQTRPLVDELLALIEGKRSPTQVATHWLEYGYEHLLWFLYLLTAEWLKACFLPQQANLIGLPHSVDPIRLFGQLKTITELQKKIRQSIHTNQQLAVETLLLGYININ